MTNALVEIGLFSVSVVLGLFGYPIWIVPVMVGVSGAWWVLVHYARIGQMLSAGALKAVGSVVLALVVVAIGHLVAFGLGGAFHAMVGLS